MNVNKIKLKVKNKSLAEEARIIKQEEKKLKGFSRKTSNLIYKREFGSAISNLRRHRVGIVRIESRATQLATAFLNGKTYKSVEPKRKPEKEHEFNSMVLPRVVNMAHKYKYGFEIYREQNIMSAAEMRKAIEAWVSA